MKQLLPIAMVLSLISACTKEQPIPMGVAQKANCQNGAARMFVDFNYVLTKDDQGEYSCPTPKVDCSKISPDPTLVLTIDDAIANETVQAFFNATNWEEKFPYLEGMSTVVAGLQSGSYTMIRETNADDNNIFYIVVVTGDPETTIHTIMVDENL